MTCAARKAKNDNGEIPAKLSVKIRPKVTAGFANEVDEVKKYAPAIQAETKTARLCDLLESIRINATINSPVLAMISATKVPKP